MTVFARSSESARSDVESSGSLNHPSVLNAGDGREIHVEAVVVELRAPRSRAREIEEALVRHAADDREPPCVRRKPVAIRAREHEHQRVVLELAVRREALLRAEPDRLAANARAASTSRSLAVTAGVVAESATSSVIDRRRARILRLLPCGADEIAAGRSEERDTTTTSSRTPPRTRRDRDSH